MNAKHSPGPWKWSRTAGQLVDGNGKRMGRELSEADGNLAAAAPELLALLREYMGVDMGTGIRPRAEALIARLGNDEDRRPR